MDPFEFFWILLISLDFFQNIKVSTKLIRLLLNNKKKPKIGQNSIKAFFFLKHNPRFCAMGHTDRQTIGHCVYWTESASGPIQWKYSYGQLSYATSVSSMAFVGSMLCYVMLHCRGIFHVFKAENSNAGLQNTNLSKKVEKSSEIVSSTVFDIE